MGNKEAREELTLFCRLFILSTSGAIVDGFHSRWLQLGLFPVMVYVYIKQVRRREEDSEKDIFEFQQRRKSAPKDILQRSIEMR